MKRNLARYRDLYPRENIEIIVVDDGSPEPAEIGANYPWPVQIIRLADKQTALNPCIPFNVGVAASSGDVIALTNPEVMHRGAIIGPMRERLEEKGYLAAACHGSGWWYCHSTLMPDAASVGRAKMPNGAGLHFFSMLHRSLYDAIGGFTESYRDGQGYEDNDLLWKLDRAGARFQICDDLVCDHIACPRSEWPKGGHVRNREIFERAWPT